MPSTEDLKQPNEDDEAADTEPSHGSNAIHRREALKKAAAGAGVIAGVWMAPRITGLSVEPDYAAAGTVRTNVSFARAQTDCGMNIFADTNCWGGCSGNTCVPVTVAQSIGGEPITITYAGNTDQNGDGTVTVNFANMDPPFNMCAITGASGDPGPGPSGQDQVVTSPTTVAIDQSPTNQGNDITISITCT